MRRIEQTGRFKRDLKREGKGQYRTTLEADLLLIVAALANDQPLAARHRDHALTGDWKHYRDCHIHPDLVLIYRLIGDDRLILTRLGSHSELDL